MKAACNFSFQRAYRERERDRGGIKSYQHTVLTYPFLAGKVDDFSPYPGFGTVRSDETTAPTRNKKETITKRENKKKQCACLHAGAKNVTNAKQKKIVNFSVMIPKTGHAILKILFVFFCVQQTHMLSHLLNKPANCR